jgi:hypothetical protein
MKVADAVTVAGHEVHVCRYREARPLLRWLGPDLPGLRVSHGELGTLLSVRGPDVIAHECQFRSRRVQRMHLGLSAYGGKYGFTAAVPVAPLVAASDRTATAAPSCSSVLDAADSPQPARGEVLTGDSAQGVGFIVVGTSTKACRGRAI